MRGLFTRTAAVTLCVTVAMGAAVIPCAAAEGAGKTTTVSLTRLSAASRQVLAKSAPAKKQQAPAGTSSSSGSFFGSTKGKVTLALMAAGVGFTVWSINHDREPVKSPVR